MRKQNGLNVYTHDEAVDMLLNENEPKPKKDNSALKILLILGVLFILSILMFSCSKKESFVTYRIDLVERPNGAFACKYSARASGQPAIVFNDECGKYKVGDTFKVEF